MDSKQRTIPAPPRKRGNRLGLWFFRVVLRGIGLRGAYGLLYGVCLHYFLFDAPARTAALAYIRRRFPAHSRFRRGWNVYRLFVSQGRNLIDRQSLMRGSKDLIVRFRNTDGWFRLLEERRGFVLLTAHVGNWQAVKNLLGTLDRKVNLVMRPEDNPAVRDSLRIDESTDRIGIISPEGFLGGVVESVNALNRGEIVSLMGDRSYGFSPVRVRFLGEDAWFASGAFHLAAQTGCPVVMVLSPKTGFRTYDVSVEAIWRPRYEPGRPKRDQLTDWVQEYARILEQCLETHPFQCFLFYDVWKQP